jgi:hypothetical protein
LVELVETPASVIPASAGIFGFRHPGDGRDLRPYRLGRLVRSP